MTNHEYATKVQQIPKGSYFKVAWNTDCTKYLNKHGKDVGARITKHVETVCRTGISYTKIRRVRDMLDSQGKFHIDPKTGKKEYLCEERPWAETVVKGMLIRHMVTRELYAVLYTSPNKPKVTFYLNGKEISAMQLFALNLLRDSYWNYHNDKDTIVMTVPVKSIESIG